MSFSTPSHKTEDHSALSVSRQDAAISLMNTNKGTDVPKVERIGNQDATILSHDGENIDVPNVESTSDQDASNNTEKDRGAQSRGHSREYRKAGHCFIDEETVDVLKAENIEKNATKPLNNTKNIVLIAESADEQHAAISSNKTESLGVLRVEGGKEGVTQMLNNAEKNTDVLKVENVSEQDATTSSSNTENTELLKVESEGDQKPSDNIKNTNVLKIEGAFKEDAAKSLTIEKNTELFKQKTLDDTENKNTHGSMAAMFKNVGDVIINGINLLVNISINITGSENLFIVYPFIVFLIVIIISMTCLCIYGFLLLREIGGYGTTQGLGRLEQFVSHGAINGSFIQDPKHEVYPGTRERVLSQIKAWIDYPNSTEYILWLHGPAGFGKTAIAQTIVDSYTIEKLSASFFFSHSDSKRNDGNLLFTTLAWQFTISIPAIKDHVARALVSRPDLPTKNVETQFQELIVRPLEALSSNLRHQLLNKVIVIDGIDECKSKDRQKQILELIGREDTSGRIPLRFLVFSRPEPHINKTIISLPQHTRSIDLAEHADNDDIERYIKDHFVNIAKDQEIDPATWPSREVIQQLVYKASGQFIYASTVVGFVREEATLAKDQLEIVLGLKPHKTTRPFANLDELYTKVLERQSDQEYLKTFLALLVAENSLSIFRPFCCRVGCTYPDLREGYGILMNLSEQDLRIKLRNMGSLLKITPDYIGLHHKSLLDFLKDPSRSGQYHFSTESAARQYLLLVVDSVVRIANESLGMIGQPVQPDYYPPVPELVEIFGRYPTSFDNVLSREDWREGLQPLLDFQNTLLNLSNFTIPRNECTIFHIVNQLLLNISYRLILFNKPEATHAHFVMPLVVMKNIREGLRPLGTYFHNLKGMFDLMYALRDVDPEVLAMRVHSSSEAQNMMDAICHIVNGEYLITRLFSAETARKATLLALEIHARIPVLPQLFLLTSFAGDPYPFRQCWPCDLEAFCRSCLISNVVDHRYILPVLAINVSLDPSVPPITLMSEYIEPINDWREKNNPNSNEIISVMVNLARAIQYFHSIGIVLSDFIELDDIYVDSKSGIRVSPTELVWSMHGHSTQEVGKRYENNINKFGELFCAVYFDTELPCTDVASMSSYKLETGIREDALQLIKQCLSTDDKPSIDEVVREMESWS